MTLCKTIQIAAALKWFEKPCLKTHHMKYRIAAGVIVENEGRILLVRHLKPGTYDSWVAPGGGAEGTEDLLATAKREVFEETGLHVEPLQLAYIEEFTNPNLRECKVWFTRRLVGGTVSTEAEEATLEHIIKTAWLSRSKFEGKTVFPPMLLNDYWTDRESGFALPRYVGLRAMEFQSGSRGLFEARFQSICLLVTRFPVEQ